VRLSSRDTVTPESFDEELRHMLAQFPGNHPNQITA
jgi:hypothetical protein